MAGKALRPVGQNLWGRAEALAKEGYELRRVPHSYQDAPRGNARSFTSDF